jgi:hypothetical protein
MNGETLKSNENLYKRVRTKKKNHIDIVVGKKEKKEAKTIKLFIKLP